MADGDLIYIDVKEFTDNVTTNTNFEVTGTGIFDIFMDTATKHLTAQLDAGRIRGEDYATAYMQVYSVTLQAALQAWLQKDLIEAQIASEKAKGKLYNRQIEGFDEDYKHKILKICMDAWAVGFSVSKDSFQASGIPAPMQKTTIDALYNQFIVTDLDRYPSNRE